MGKKLTQFNPPSCVFLTFNFKLIKNQRQLPPSIVLAPPLYATDHRNPTERRRQFIDASPRYHRKTRSLLWRSRELRREPPLVATVGSPPTTL